jgi:hypothetical protein
MGDAFGLKARLTREPRFTLPCPEKEIDDEDHPHAVDAVVSNPPSGTSQLPVGTYEYDANGNMTCRFENNQYYKQSYNTGNRISAIVKRDDRCDGTMLAQSRNVTHSAK